MDTFSGDDLAREFGRRFGFGYSFEIPIGWSLQIRLHACCADERMADAAEDDRQRVTVGDVCDIDRYHPGDIVPFG